MRRFVSPYKKYIGWAVLLNILSAVFNVFSFTFLIPILSILFKTEGADKVYHFMEWGIVHGTMGNKKFEVDGGKCMSDLYVSGQPDKLRYCYTRSYVRHTLSED